MVVGKFNTPLLPIGRSSKQKNPQKKILELNDTTDKMDLTFTKYFIQNSKMAARGRKQKAYLLK
jgi:hypothetical protein